MAMNKLLYVAAVVMTCMMLRAEMTDAVSNNDTLMNRNGTATNGTATNGTAINGTTTSGPVTNGTTISGPMTNGTATNETTLAGNAASNNASMTNGSVAVTGSNGTGSNETNNNGTSNSADIPVGVLTRNITRDECQQSQACFSKPDNCDPAAAGSCLFASTRAGSNTSNNIIFEIRGESLGYIAAGLSNDSQQGGNDTVFACVNNNGRVRFVRARLDNNKLTQDNSGDISDAEGSVNGKVIQCIFTAAVNDLVRSTRASDSTSFHILLMTGNVTNGQLDTPNIALFSINRVDLTNPNSTAITNSTTTTNSTSAPTVAATTASGSNGLQQFASQGLLFLIGVHLFGLLWRETQ